MYVHTLPSILLYSYLFYFCYIRKEGATGLVSLKVSLAIIMVIMLAEGGSEWTRFDLIRCIVPFICMHDAHWHEPMRVYMARVCSVSSMQ